MSLSLWIKVSTELLDKLTLNQDTFEKGLSQPSTLSTSSSSSFSSSYHSCVQSTTTVSSHIEL